MDASHAFYGIVITVHFRDRPSPHFHARSGERVADIAIDALELIDAWLSPRALRLALEWPASTKPSSTSTGTRRRTGTLVGIDPLP